MDVVDVRSRMVVRISGVLLSETSFEDGSTAELMSEGLAEGCSVDGETGSIGARLAGEVSMAAELD